MTLFFCYKGAMMKTLLYIFLLSNLSCFLYAHPVHTIGISLCMFVYSCCFQKNVVTLDELHRILQEPSSNEGELDIVYASDLNDDIPLQDLINSRCELQDWVETMHKAESERRKMPALKRKVCIPVRYSTEQDILQEQSSNESQLNSLYAFGVNHDIPLQDLSNSRRELQDWVEAMHKAEYERCKMLALKRQVPSPVRYSTD
jgi:gamma-glutamyltranspeptidase